MSYEIAASLTANGLGQSICLGIGGDPVVGLNFVEALEKFRADENPFIGYVSCSQLFHVSAY
jgi:succinyl-CoA synthetase alpha subunit